MDYELKVDEITGEAYLEIRYTDKLLLTDPFLNKDLAFDLRERKEFGLMGFLPEEIIDLSEQCVRAYSSFRAKNNNLEKYIFLRRIQDTNETLFYALLKQHLEEMLPVIYTPTIGIACQQFSEIYRYPRGLFLTYPDKNMISSILANPALDRIHTIVVTDGERILGLGDQGAGGMGIPIGKLSLYTLCGGISPDLTLPIFLDTGTNNKERLNDPLYLGWKHERIRGQDYDDFIETFVSVIKKRFPWVLLHWEDFSDNNAYSILTRYHDRLCTLNGDIQGTAGIALSVILAALNVTKLSIKDQRVVVVGASSIACKIGEWITQAMMEAGLDEQTARLRFYLVDPEKGLLLDDMPDLESYQQAFALPRSVIDTWKNRSSTTISLDDVVLNAHPTVLVGLCGKPGIFTESIVRNMAEHVDRPIILPLSNPQEKSEAQPQQLLEWTNYKAIIGTGSPFNSIMKGGKLFRIDQANNIYIFPGIGLGLVVTQARRAVDELFLVAAKALAECSPAKSDPEGNLLPNLNQIRNISMKIALAVAKKAIELGLSDVSSDQLEESIQRAMWTPVYLPYRKKR